LSARDQAGSVDILVHAAGGSSAWKTVRELEHGEWTDIIDSDLNGFFNSVNATLKIMHEQRRGTIVAISSIAARACSPRSAQTAAAKAGLEAMIRVIAREEGRYGIRANAVSVGLTDTDMGQEAVKHWQKRWPLISPLRPRVEQSPRRSGGAAPAFSTYTAFATARIQSPIHG